MFDWTILLLAYLWVVGGLSCIDACEARAGTTLTRPGRILGVLFWPALTLASIGATMVRELAGAWSGQAMEPVEESRRAA